MRSAIHPDATRQHIRQIIRQHRRALTPDQQQLAAQDLLEHCQQSATLLHAQHIALYLANDGELDTQPVIDWLWHQGKSVYLPVLHPFSKGNLLFLHYTPDTRMTANRYQIREPMLDIRLVKPITELDVIATPLVAFDNTGQRLGMGGGYYDRTLNRWHQERQGPRPIGLAHDCQQVDTLPVEAWDVPLPEIITPSYHFHW
ncbi:MULTISPECIES: 5-formyltetrahydrofolate cyclo-ligase [Photobacterium]|uniref:5-formyltetrahydrofolate cyclo-ligase n=1 Tax=Photobacterium ganghwense TaxID=320778 RepID=A0A0J1H3Y1_9GAMM|nr:MULTISPECIES: 5-formyltetrahydrofolate cyclo-ligase [Photobacterium]KLV06486.1 5-formyltetrahydrofolate cyclo-ligase [Photobacterium ganghwense]MBV1840348.1 5-formyltetrahydrofolate cyclo-ligase [Photobacterium ganghwense]PSU06630.1 5-formyltetrahydrofolate cyclo-ligase [Photobacterium ganghwense]QSV14526.1 5-formyltetrahydrofolate cyclo-ligase [Photobacterium ganghwense]